jgi:hypothetical protein
MLNGSRSFHTSLIASF